MAQHNHRLEDLMRQCGYTSRILAGLTGASIGSVEAWMYKSTMPSNDDIIRSAAKALHAEPTDIWPEWQPRQTGQRRLNVGKWERSELRLGWNRVETMQQSGLWIGKRFTRVINHGRGGFSYHRATVVQMTPNWFRVKIDAGKTSYSECFTYQALREKELKPYKEV